MIFIAAGIIFIISFLLALWSLRQELQRNKHVHHIQESLAQERVLFYRPAHTGKSEHSQQ